MNRYRGVDGRAREGGVVREVGDELQAGHLAERVEHDARVVEVWVRPDSAVHGVTSRVNLVPPAAPRVVGGERQRLLREIVDVEAIAQACTYETATIRLFKFDFGLFFFGGGGIFCHSTEGQRLLREVIDVEAIAQACT